MYIYICLFSGEKKTDTERIRNEFTFPAKKQLISLYSRRKVKVAFAFWSFRLV